jgi:hypothetical protein
MHIMLQDVVFKTVLRVIFQTRIKECVGTILLIVLMDGETITITVAQLYVLLLPGIHLEIILLIYAQ